MKNHQIVAVQLPRALLTDIDVAAELTSMSRRETVFVAVRLGLPAAREDPELQPRPDGVTRTTPKQAPDPSQAAEHCPHCGAVKWGRKGQPRRIKPARLQASVHLGQLAEIDELATERNCTRAYVLRKCLEHGVRGVVAHERQMRAWAKRQEREGIAAAKRRMHQMMPPPA